MKTAITPEQALKQIKNGHLGQLEGMDEQGLTHVFDDASDVTLLTYHQNNQVTPAAIIKENEDEILENAANAKGCMLRLVCGRNHDLLMNDMIIIKNVESLFPEGIDFSWDVEHAESTDFKLRIDLYIITQ